MGFSRLLDDECWGSSAHSASFAKVVLLQGYTTIAMARYQDSLKRRLTGPACTEQPSWICADRRLTAHGQREGRSTFQHHQQDACCSCVTRSRGHAKLTRKVDEFFRFTERGLPYRSTPTTSRIDQIRSQRRSVDRSYIAGDVQTGRLSL